MDLNDAVMISRPACFWDNIKNIFLFCFVLFVCFQTKAHVGPAQKKQIFIPLSQLEQQFHYEIKHLHHNSFILTQKPTHTINQKRKENPENREEEMM